MDLKMDTAGVVAVANKIADINKAMFDSYEDVNSAFSVLAASWEGETARSCISKLREGSEEIRQARFNVLDNYVDFLEKSVAEGYETVEKNNISLAEKFK